RHGHLAAPARPDEGVRSDQRGHEGQRGRVFDRDAMSAMQDGAQDMQCHSRSDTGSPGEFLRVRGVRKDFGAGEQRRNVLSGVDFSIERGSFVSLLGASGCGKSTLLQIIAGLQQPDEGAVELEGEGIQAPPFQMLYLFQQYTKSIFPWRSVRGNIAFG